MYPEYGSDWIPHPIDSMEKPNIFVQRDIPLLVHAPSNRATKHTAFILDVFKIIKRMRKVEIVILEGLPFDEVVRLKKASTIYFDQFRVGFYGNAAIETMQYGIPTAAWISGLSKIQGDLRGCPVITYEKNVTKWAYKICEILDSDMTKLSQRTKAWCDKVHSYEAVLKKCNGILKRL